MSKYHKLVVDEALDFQGNATIRLDDGTPNGNTEENPVATVYGNTAYAELFASSPLMLETLQSISGDAHELMRGHNLPESVLELVGAIEDAAQAAIAKAEGR